MTSEFDPYPSNWTHRLLVRKRGPTDRSYNVRLIEAENAVLEWALEHGTALRVLVWEDELDARAPAALEALRTDFRRVSDERRLWDPNLGTEFHRSLEGDGWAAMAPFSISPESEPAWRLYDVKQILVVDDDEWRYHSTPDEVHVRNVNLRRIDATTKAELRGAVRSLDEACLVARSDMISWNAGERRYELRAGTTGVELVIDGSTRSRAYDLDAVAAIEFDETNLSAVFTWSTPDGSISTRIRRQLGGLLGRRRPSELRFPDAETMESVREALDRISTACEYDVRLRNRR
ncbi:hypothetical protein [Natrinema longum]|uniref:Uncharacterized protein n=1 Tax=Natrinema longum TaxID=370324 RepID=A0A8A2U3V1_9EURY|nr:hypothetical protein [Natrinema longum]MBZ6494872.1 hypothetical protein [Natrinema longum]QSW83829.1 hypothetical protein J0X27_10080 [Natrinema longum]